MNPIETIQAALEQLTAERNTLLAERDHWKGAYDALSARLDTAQNETAPKKWIVNLPVPDASFQIGGNPVDLVRAVHPQAEEVPGNPGAFIVTAFEQPAPIPYTPSTYDSGATLTWTQGEPTEAVFVLYV